MSLRTPYVCFRCLQSQRPRKPPVLSTKPRSFSSAPPLSSAQAQSKDSREAQREDATVRTEEEGAMSRRLADMAEESMESGGRSARKVMEEAGFSEELKKQLEERIAQSSFKSEHAAAFSEITMPSSAGRGTRDQAAAQAWAGTETLEDAALRMLTDSNKPLRTPFKIPRPGTGPVNLRPAKKVKQSSGERLVNARDKASIYENVRDASRSEKEREQMRKEFKDRFTPGARPMPATLQGLASLANERIEDAIARGQFKNIPRGKGTNVERDYNANSPFLDTTEYFMNKIIQKQDIVPPWIEKQQELIKNVETFRKRLRSDWRRHAARMVASKGGTIDQQVKRAQLYADAEARLNPKKVKVAALSTIDSQGNIHQVTVQETPPAQQPPSPEGEAQSTIITISEEQAPPAAEPIASSSTSAEISQQSPLASQPEEPYTPIQTLTLFRDEAWLKTEAAYHKLAVESLNSLTRSYNLMAPKIAQKPYYSLTRELNSCFADVAPQLTDEILQRARAPPERVRVEVIGHRSGGVMEKFGAGERVKVWDEQKPTYGFKEFWKDLWGPKEQDGMRA